MSMEPDGFKPLRAVTKVKLLNLNFFLVSKCYLLSNAFAIDIEREREYPDSGYPRLIARYVDDKIVFLPVDYPHKELADDPNFYGSDCPLEIQPNDEYVGMTVDVSEGLTYLSPLPAKINRMQSGTSFGLNQKAQANSHLHRMKLFSNSLGWLRDSRMILSKLFDVLEKLGYKQANIEPAIKSHNRSQCPEYQIRIAKNSSNREL